MAQEPDQSRLVNFVAASMKGIFWKQGSVCRDGGRFRLRWREYCWDRTFRYRSITIPTEELANSLESALGEFRSGFRVAMEATRREVALRHEFHAWVLSLIKNVHGRTRRRELVARLMDLALEPGAREMLEILGPWPEESPRRGRPRKHGDVEPGMDTLIPEGGDTHVPCEI